MYDKEYYENNKKSILANKRRGYHKNKVLKGYPSYKGGVSVDKPKEYVLFMSAKHRAKKKGLPFEIDIDDIIIPETCPVLGIKLCIDNRKTNGDSPSLDQKKAGLGYTKDNIQIISWRANKIKSDATIEEIEAVLAYMRN